MIDINGIMRAIRARSRYIHISTGPGYRPRSASPGHVRGEGQKGSTYDRGRNAEKRARKALHRLAMS